MNFTCTLCHWKVSNVTIFLAEQFQKPVRTLHFAEPRNKEEMENFRAYSSLSHDLKSKRKV